ncbi:hypothetical protein Sgleb_39050 [Streptomyces glebosus]|uniref:Uncharacterized protein n=1 Tax=Streptomyces glebosus TaxID=249580 RepID=A0A640SXU7_9ACTN|nr:hypothetical protein Sgleb_39050 [Streptomyces glebosus]GHG67805.1 hypothetical protein GCM10010513_37950 [Streptomyces glebosus]
MARATPTWLPLKQIVGGIVGKGLMKVTHARVGCASNSPSRYGRRGRAPCCLSCRPRGWRRIRDGAYGGAARVRGGSGAGAARVLPGPPFRAWMRRARPGSTSIDIVSFVLVRAIVRAWCETQGHEMGGGGDG